MNLENKVVLVTGASSGIGAAIALQFAKEGAKVAIVGRNENKLKRVVAECEKLGSKPLLIIADVSKDADVKRVMDSTVKQFGQLDVLVNNAGMSRSAGIADENAMQAIDQVMDVNIRSIVHFVILATPHLIKSKGNIINISSVASLGVMSTKSFAYCCSKASLDHFSRCVAIELGPMGVRCNTVNPGPVLTDILENSGLNEAYQEAVWRNFKKSTALDRISDPIEMADLVVFLASGKAQSITGASFIADNGAVLKGGLKSY